MSRPRNKRKFDKQNPPKRTDNAQNDFFSEVSTVNSYLYFTRPYPFNPDEVVGKKGLKKYTEMYRDEQVKAAMLAKQFAVIAPGWDIEPAQYEGDTENQAAQEIADFVEQNFSDIEGSFDTKLLEMLSAFVYGFSIAEKVFWHMNVGQFTGKVGLKDLKFRNPEGFDFRTDPFGNLLPDGVLQATRPLPAEKFMIYSYRKRFSNLYGDSDMRECYRSTWCKDNAIKFMMITLERYGEPTWLFNVKGTLKEGNQRSLENFMRDIQSKSGLILPDSITADPKHPAPEAAKNYLPILEYLDGLIRAALGMPSLIGPSSTEQKGGSYARAQTQYDLFLNLMRFLRNDVEANINEQIIKQLVDFNYEITDGKYPYFKFKEISEEEKQQLYDNYLKGLQAKGMTKTREDELFFRDHLGIPTLPEDYPVAGEVTPEIQAQQDAQKQAILDAQAEAIKNPQPKNPDASNPNGSKPPVNGKPADKQPVPPAKLSDEQKIETESDRHAREYADYKTKQQLQNYLINNDRNRDLTSDEARHVQTMMPKAVSMQYLDVPGVDQMHKDMGIDPNLDTDVKKYHQAKVRLFNKQPKRRLALDSLTLTQTHVHKGRIESMSHDAETLNAPVQVLKYGQSYYLMDGHHRLIARHLAGKKYAMANVYNPPITTYERHDHSKRALTKYEQRVDFAQAKKVLDKSEADIKQRLKDELKKIQDSTLKWIQDNGANLKSSDVSAFTIDQSLSPSQLQQTLKDMFETAWTDGRDAGASELPAKVRKTPAVQDVKTFSDWASVPWYLAKWQEVEYHSDIGGFGPGVLTMADEWAFCLTKRFANAFEPTDALDAFENRAWLIQDVIDAALQSQVRYELFESLKGGRTLGDTIDNIRQVFEPWIGDPSKVEPGSEDLLQAFRLENIVRTESTWAYNQGRVAVGDAAGEYLLGYQFSAIIDERTCFQKGTGIKLANGKTVSIESIKPGEFVISGAGIPRRVLAAWRYPAKRWNRIKCEDGCEIVSTPTHQFWTKNGWTDASDIEDSQTEVGTQSTARIERTSMPSVWPLFSPVQQQSAQVLLKAMQYPLGIDTLQENQTLSTLRETSKKESRYKKKILQRSMLDSSNGRMDHIDMRILQNRFSQNEKRPTRKIHEPILQSQMLSCQKSESDSKNLPSLSKDIFHTSEQRRSIQRLLQKVFARTAAQRDSVKDSQEKVHSVSQDFYPTVEAESDIERCEVVQREVPPTMERWQSDNNEMSGLYADFSLSQTFESHLLFDGLLQEVGSHDSYGKNGRNDSSQDESRLREAKTAWPILNRFSYRQLACLGDGWNLLAQQPERIGSTEECNDKERGIRSSSIQMRQSDSTDRRFTAADANHAIEPTPTGFVRVISNESFEKVDWAYDLEIENDHSYIAEGLIVHNTEVCRKADGLIIRKDTSASVKLTPPLHYQCRSLLVFVTTDDAPVQWSSEKEINAAIELIQKGFK